MKKIVAALFAVAIAPAVLAATPAENFKAKCAVCHGADGKGNTPVGQSLGIKNLTTTKLSAADIEKTILAGKGKMTGFQGKIPDAEVKALAGWVKGGLK